MCLNGIWTVHLMGQTHLNSIQLMGSEGLSSLFDLFTTKALVIPHEEKSL